MGSSQVYVPQCYISQCSQWVWVSVKCEGLQVLIREGLGYSFHGARGHIHHRTSGFTMPWPDTEEQSTIPIHGHARLFGQEEVRSADTQCQE